MYKKWLKKQGVTRYVTEAVRWHMRLWMVLNGKGHRCPECSVPFFKHEQIKMHQERVDHKRESTSSEKLDTIYTFYQLASGELFCPMGCEVELTPMSNGRTVHDQGSKERSLDKMKMRDHFLTCHTDEELF